MKTLKYIEGNLLLDKTVDVIGHQANCQNTFGSGIARTIKEMYPEAYAADTQAAKERRNVLGDYSTAFIEHNPHGTKLKYIFNLYGQNLGTDRTKLNNRNTNYEALYSALQKMSLGLSTWQDTCEYTVGFPYLMGSALGGGDWRIVSRLIEVAFSDYKGDVLIVKLV